MKQKTRFSAEQLIGVETGPGYNSASVYNIGHPKVLYRKMQAVEQKHCQWDDPPGSNLVTVGKKNSLFKRKSPPTESDFADWCNMLGCEGGKRRS